MIGTTLNLLRYRAIQKTRPAVGAFKSLPTFSSSCFSSSHDDAPMAAADNVNQIYPEEISPYALGKHRSNALDLISKIPIIEVDGSVAVCDGGGGALGHPAEYITLAHGQIGVCKYCGLKFKSKGGHH
uniref:Zinc finger CHCC-type domain-containing protein n=1 Tax=Corethron hystrix TaxID=216773 RepID=A0A7S1BJP3_9STRA|mmetsp:Transcript_28867/g.66051  ORF Transcript_28867/g.66051 Transcript_28867/m.66051 type:complete len:128 (+) Transcript_28867:149-532(+)